jgi:hypothetical protein
MRAAGSSGGEMPTPADVPRVGIVPFARGERSTSSGLVAAGMPSTWTMQGSSDFVSPTGAADLGVTCWKRSRSYP